VIFLFFALPWAIFSLALENFIIIIGVILRNFKGIVCEVKLVMLQGYRPALINKVQRRPIWASHGFNYGLKTKIRDARVARLYN